MPRRGALALHLLLGLDDEVPLVVPFSALRRLGWLVSVVAGALERLRRPLALSALVVVGAGVALVIARSPRGHGTIAA